MNSIQKLNASASFLGSDSMVTNSNSLGFCVPSPQNYGCTVERNFLLKWYSSPLVI